MVNSAVRGAEESVNSADCVFLIFFLCVTAISSKLAIVVITDSGVVNSSMVTVAFVGRILARVDGLVDMDTVEVSGSFSFWKAASF